MASGNDENYIKTIKMAIALACIRSKPEGLTAGEYTEQLCQNFLKKQQICQQKLKAAESEILQLKQQLVLGQNVTATGSDTGDLSLLTPPQSGAMLTQSTLDSGQLTQNTAFLQSILNLQCVTRTPQLSTVTQSTLENSLTMIKQCIQNQANIPLSAIQKNVHIIMGVLDSEQIVNLVQVADLVLDIVTCILEVLLSKEHETSEYSECLVELVTSFCHSRLFEKIVKLTLEIIDNLSDHLRNVSQKKDKLDILKYWNMYHIFRILENVFNKHRHHNLLSSTEYVDKINDRLDQTLLHLSDPFPLFAHAVWKIQGILNQIYLSRQP